MDETHYQKLLNKDFDWTGWNLEQFISVGSECVTSKSLHQRVLGRLAMALGSEYGQQTIATYAQSVNVAPKTIYDYIEVETKLNDYEVPEDFNWSARKALARSGAIEKYLQQATDEGWSGSQLTRQIKMDKGQITPQNECQSCHTVITHVECPKCHAVVKNVKL